MEFIIKTLETLGTILIAWAALRVHHRFLNEHKISNRVFLTMQIEQKFGFLGVILVISSYVLDLFF